MSIVRKSFPNGASLAAAVVLSCLPVLVYGAKVDFNREVRPILSDNCFACHGPDVQKIKGGLRLDIRDAAIAPAKSGKLAIVAGKPRDSELVRRLETTDADDLMPPPESHKTLTAAQRATLIQWITEGAEYQGHWAYQPPVRPPAPSGPSAIDELVRRRFGPLGIKPTAEADRRTLARRLHFDLVGLPPSPADVAAFEQDSSPDAYERLVDRLLSSPHYGERMAIQWLDVTRFADTIGYHSDNPRNIWPYRDYVIQAFNRNKPFDTFTREQIAGDLLPGGGLESLVGSAFNRLLLTTEEGGAQTKDYESRYLTDRVRAIGTVWMGQTIGCAQCHDHKFDPISTRDFYAMGAFFADVKETIIGRREDGIFVPDEKQAAELHRRREVLRSLEADFNGPHPELNDAYASWEKGWLEAMAAEDRWSRLIPARADSAEGATLKIRDDRSILASGKNPDLDTYTIHLTNAPSRIIALRVEALPDDSLPAKGPGRAGNGNFVLNEVTARIERSGAPVRTLSFATARATHEQTSHAENNPYKAWTAAATIDLDAKGPVPGWAILPETGKTHQLLLELAAPAEIAPGETLVVELRQRHGHGSHTLGRFRLSASDRPDAVRSPGALPPPPALADLLRVPAKDRNAEQSAKLRTEFRKATPSLAGLRSLLEDSRKALGDFESTLPRCIVTERGEPRTVRVLPRGNWLVETGDIMEPALPVALSANYAKPSRKLSRLDLAEWIVAPENPLTTRTVMNRLWRQFFGIGLSKVLDDLGAQGEPPVNQPLLDWLACEFRDSGWDMRHMVRTIVLSQTYRQASTTSRDEIARDPENRDLARQSRWRLDAELVRDNALALSGLLSPVVGGPSARPYQPDGYWENLNFPQRGYDASAGAAQYRRGLYTWWQRSYTHPSMLAFDAPTREECAAERSRSNIPQQALVLLNDPSYVEAARNFATRILHEAPKDTRGRIAWAWQQALARPATPEELQTLTQLFEKQLAEFTADPDAARAFIAVGMNPPPKNLSAAELAAWTDIARAILNLHETITRS
jgi:hypothetical protein